MKKLPLFIFAVMMVAIISCKPSVTEYAITWSNDIKAQIIADANETADSIFKGSTIIEYYKGDRKLKEIHLDNNLKDTVASILYGADRQFEIVREHCNQVINAHFEGIKYVGRFWGWTEIRYCNGQIKTTGLRYLSRQAGIWTTYDESGKIIETKDYGHVDELEALKVLHYRRDP